jgi:CRISPR-associated protein Cas2
MSGLNCYVVSYDIMDRKRLSRVHTAMKGFGQPVHYSVFRCDLTLKGRVEMVAILSELIKVDEDRIMIIDMGPTEGGADDRIEFLGVHHEDKDEKFIIV